MHAFAGGVRGGEEARYAATDVAARGDVAGVEREVVSHELVEEESCFRHGEGFGGAGAAGQGVAWE